jgi:hypothetical protein
VLCPAFIRTRIAESGRNWPERLGANPSPPTDSPMAGVMRQLVDNGLDPAVYAARVVDAVRTGRFFVMSDEAHAGATRGRLAEIVDGTPPRMLTL